ncbi:MAG: TonB C-terminal domain-containing protein [Candidatus Aminicenantes bacterium]|nr:TonB C-terminal domain-containing protein [Candidatus Aminicenantes bacterium]
MSDFPFTWYVEDIRKKVYESWIVSVIQIGTEKPLTTWVYFRIFRDGSTSRVEVKAASGLQVFDMVAVRAITNARFAPLPPEYDQEYLGINLVFEHVR